MSLEILYEDNHVIVINKKASDIVQGDKTGDVTLPDRIKAYLKEKYNKPGNVFCGVVHRLDRPTSGAVIFARTSKALERLNKQFRDKETNKVYWAIVEQKPEKNSDRLVHFLRKNENQNKSYVCDKNAFGAKEAILTYNFLKSSDNYHLLEIELETGRHHQIRVQLATISCTIKGDLKYGSKRSNQDGSICLHARKISFIHPTSKEQIEITAPVPDNPLWNFFQK
ncbi:MAG: RluA family pseudouridine synthase [Bacteroidota bacterium]